MSKTVIIRDVCIVNENEIFHGDILIKNERIEKIESRIEFSGRCEEWKGTGLYVFPGVIDDQVHFREPGYPQKGNIFSESRAAVAGGITSFMEMPNTVPPAVTRDLLEEKYKLAEKNSFCNYSFYIGASDDNLEEIKKTDYSRVCGIKIFLGSSTGNLKLKDFANVEALFRHAPAIIAAHCEKDEIIEQNVRSVVEQYGEDIPPYFHPIIRNEEACHASSMEAISLARRENARLHVLHISTARELELFEKNIPVHQKRITAEACIHHLWFYDEDYEKKGNLIKWNPAIKTLHDRESIRNALKEGRIDVIATDHAPHTLEEKQQPLLKAPSGGPLVQHALPAMLELYHQGVFSLEQIVDWMCHKPASLFGVVDRGFLREGYYADLVLVNLHQPFEVNRQNILYHCGWSSFEGTRFESSVVATMVNGQWAYEKGTFQTGFGKRLLFNGNLRG